MSAMRIRRRPPGGLRAPEFCGRWSRRSRRSGSTQLWLTDSSLHARNSYAYLTLAAHAIVRGCCSAPPSRTRVTRHPAITATAAATVDEISGGRMILGSARATGRCWRSASSPARWRRCGRRSARSARLWTGEHVDRRGPAFTLRDAHMRFPARAGHPRLHLGERAENARARRRDRRRRDPAGGAVPRGARVGPGARRPRRRDGGPRRARTSRCSPTGRSTRTRRRRWSRRARSRPGSRRPRPCICELAGLPADLVEGVRARYAGGEFQEAAAAARLLPDEFVRTVALAGNAPARGRADRRRPRGGGGLRARVPARARGGWRRSGVRAPAVARRRGQPTGAVSTSGLARDPSAPRGVRPRATTRVRRRLTGLLGTAAHEEAAPGFIERMYPVGEAYVRRSRQPATGSSSASWTAGARPASPRVRGRGHRCRGRRSAGSGRRLVDDEPRPGGMGTRIAFVHPSAFGGLLVELVERRAGRLPDGRGSRGRRCRPSTRRRGARVFSGRHDRRKVTDWVYEEVREAIIDLRLKPGEPLREATMAEQLGVSKTPVREALTRLEQEGLVETASFKGAVVSGYSARPERDLRAPRAAGGRGRARGDRDGLARRCWRTAGPHRAQPHAPRRRAADRARRPAGRVRHRDLRAG